MKKISMMLVIVLILSLISFGCAAPPDETGDNGDVIDDEGANEDPVDPNENDPVDNTEEQTIEGTFTGWIDNNSFEIIANDAPYAIRINEDVTMPDDELDGKNVRVTYVVNEQGQNIIESIEVVD